MRELYKYIYESILDDDDIFLDNMDKPFKFYEDTEKWIKYHGKQLHQGYLNGMYWEMISADNNLNTFIEWQHIKDSTPIDEQTQSFYKFLHGIKDYKWTFGASDWDYHIQNWIEDGKDIPNIVPGKIYTNMTNKQMETLKLLGFHKPEFVHVEKWVFLPTYDDVHSYILAIDRRMKPIEKELVLKLMKSFKNKKDW